MKQKKGIELSQAFGAVLTLVLVAVLIIVAIVIFVNLSSSFAGTASASINGEIISIPTTEGISLGGTSNCSSAGFSVSSMQNSSTTGLIISSGNYSVSDAGIVTNLTNEFITDSWVVNYSYTWGSEACTASENMTSEFSNYTSLIGLVGTIIFLGLVIGVLVASFAFGGGRRV